MLPVTLKHTHGHRIESANQLGTGGEKYPDMQNPEIVY